MAAATAQIKAVITAEDRASVTLQNFSKSVNRAAGDAQKSVSKTSFSFRQMANSAGQTFSAIATGMENLAKKALILATASGFGASKFVSLASDLQTTQAQMAALSGSTKQASKTLGELYTFTLGKPIAFPDAAKAARTIMGFGVATKDVLPAMKTLSAFSIVSGANMEQLANVYGQVNAKGRLMGQEINQLTSNFVPVNQIISKHFNVSMAKAQEMMETGVISAKDFNRAMANFIPQAEIAKQSNTFKNRMISLQGSVRKFGLALLGVKVDEKLGLVVQPGGLFDRMSKLLPEIAKSLSKATPKLIAFIDYILRNGATVKALILAIGAAYATAKISGEILKISKAMETMQKGNWIAIALTVAITLIVFLQQKFDIFGKTARGVITAWQAVNSFFKNLWHDIQNIFGGVAKWFHDRFFEAKNAVIGAFNAVKDAVKKALNAIAGFIVKHKKVIIDWAIVIGTILLPKIVAIGVQWAITAFKATVAFAEMALQAMFNASKVTVAWVASAAKTAFVWVTQTLPKMLLAFGEMSLQALFNASKIAVAFVASSLQTTGAWALTFLKYGVGLLWIVAQTAWAAIRMAASWLLAMGPIGAIVAIAIGAALLIMRHWETVKKFFVGVWQTSWLFAKDAVDKIISFFGGLGGKLKSFGGGIIKVVTSPFRTAFNAIAKLWNNTVGKISFKAPEWVPKFGGKGWSMPKIPELATGTDFFSGGSALVGERGPEIVNLPRGSQVVPNNKMSTAPTINMNVNIGMYAGTEMEKRKVAQAIMSAYNDAMSAKGMAV